MTDILTGYRTYLAGQSTVTDVLGSRIDYANTGQGSTFPRAILTLIDSEPARALSGNTNKVRSRIQVDVQHNQSHATAYDALDRIRRVTDGYRGAMGSETAEHTYFESGRTGFEPSGDGSQNHIKVASADVIIRHTQTAAST